jgi:hypothetical protein
MALLPPWLLAARRCCYRAWFSQARRAAGQRAELPGQVGLVEVAAVGGQVREQVIATDGQLPR